MVELKDAKVLLKEDDDLIITVYDYWLNKRLKGTVSHTYSPLISVFSVGNKVEVVALTS